ncbi:MAG: hypothetical protein EBU66_17570 [Bacteroidetes bacterium]|nr:hypothetical protein [bacterium]NBP66441.1 hypothetical protein [Bacteroidota bacterium]
MIGIVLTLVFGAVIFYLYNRLSMTERKMGLVEGVLTDLKIMMDSAPFAMNLTQTERPSMQEFEPSPEYLNAISGPFPLKEEEVEDVISSDDDYKQAMEQATPLTGSDTPYKSLQIDELAGVPVTATNAISVTKLSPDLDAMSLKELQALAKQKNVNIPTGTRRKAIIDLLKGSDEQTTGIQGTLLSEVSGPEPVGGSLL